MTTNLARRLTIAEAVHTWREAEATLTRAFADIADAEARLNLVFADHDADSEICRPITVNGYTRGSNTRTVDFREPSATLMKLRHEVWRALISRTEVRRLMSVKRWKELEDDLAQERLPDITERSVSELAEGFFANRDAMLKEAVEEVFNWLRPPGSRYERNSEYEVPARVALSRVVERWNLGGSPFRVLWDREQQLIALENALHALDGHGQIAKANYSAISLAVKEPAFRGVGETDLFAFRCYKNGSLHLTFKRLDLLARFNAIAGGKRLRT